MSASVEAEVENVYRSLPCEILVPPQYTDPSLDGMVLNPWNEAAIRNAACGPAAMVALGRYHFGEQSATLRDVVKLAWDAGVWDPGVGMHGAAQLYLLGCTVLPIVLEWTYSWDRVDDLLLRGMPLVIDTPAHYFVIDAKFGQDYHVGNSGRAFKAGDAWLSQSKMENLAGQLRAIIYMKDGA